MSTEIPEGVDPETGEIVERTPAPVVMFSSDEARAHTAKIVSFGGVLVLLLHEAYDREAWRALGYASFAAYCKAEFDYSKTRAYQMLRHAVVLEQLAEAAEVDQSTFVDSVPEGHTRLIDASQAVAVLSKAIRDLPTDAPIKTRGDLIREVTKMLTAQAKAAPEPTISPSQVPAPGAGESGGETSPVLPAATSPEVPTAQRDEDDGDSATEQGTDADEPSVSDLAVGAAPDARQSASGENAENPSGTSCGEDLGQEAGGASDGSTPASQVGVTASATEGPASNLTSDPESISSAGSGSLDRAQVSTAFAAALTLLTFDPLEAAGLLVGAERDERAQDCERITDWLRVHHDAVMDRTLRSVG